MKPGSGSPYAPGCSISVMGRAGAPWIGKTAKTFVTCDSRVVPHRSTEQAQGCLTSEFGWDPVFSPWYERMMRMNRRPGIPTVQGQCAGGGARGAQCPPFGPDLRRFCVRLVVETRAFCMGMPHARLEGGRRGSKVPPCPISFACGDFEPFVFAPFYSKTVEIQTCRGIADSQSPPPRRQKSTRVNPDQSTDPGVRRVCFDRIGLGCLECVLKLHNTHQ